MRAKWRKAGERGRMETTATGSKVTRKSLRGGKAAIHHVTFFSLFFFSCRAQLAAICMPIQ